MKRWFKLKLLLLCAALITCGLNAQQHQVGGRISVRAVIADTGGLDSWLDAKQGKLIYDDGASAALGQAQLFFDSRWSRILSTHVRLQFHDNIDESVDLTQAFLRIKPIPKSELSSTWRIGAFYPAWSVENKEKGWHSPYTITNSAINSWIGEELRIIGFEYRLKRSGRRVQSHFDWSIAAGIFNHNDTAGTVLGFRGWTLHDRQTGLFEELPLPPISPIVSGRFNRQSPTSDVFTEIDNKEGFYVNAELEKIGSTLVRYAYYDNQANGRQIQNGQYTWGTYFHHVALKTRLGEHTEFLSQYMIGNTKMGVSSVIDVDYKSWFAMVSHLSGAWRFSVRAEIFEADEQQIETTYFDFSEDGDAITLAAFYQFNKKQRLGFEFLSVSSDRPARVTLGDPIHLDESSLIVNWEYRL